MTLEDYNSLLEAYNKAHGFPFGVCGPEGKLVHGGRAETDCACKGVSDIQRIGAARQTLAFGEPIIGLCCDNGFGYWAVPLMNNAEVAGALVVQGIDLESREPDHLKRIRRAAEGLVELAIEQNLTNAAALQVARERAQREQEHFLVIEASKEAWSKDELRTTYLREEPSLLTAIKEGRTPEARSILNRILTSIYSIAEENMDLLKSSVLELVVMMSRAAVEAGANPSLLLGNNYRFITDLAVIDDEEDLAVWLRTMLDSLIEQIHKSEAYPHFLVLNKALTYMEEHLHEPLKRDDVARHVGMSPGHFSKIMTERLGRSFTELLNQYRINRAKYLITRSGYNLTAIALECGFFDQSHLSRTFRKSTGLSPGNYRKKMLEPE